MPSSPPGAAFIALRQRLQTARREAGNAWTAHRIAAELHAYVTRIGTFEGGPAAAADAVCGLRLRRELVEACASRADTQPSEAAALAAVAQLVGDACASLLARGDVQDLAVAAALAILQHELALSFGWGD